MRILHTIPGRNWGGMEHRTLEQVRWLQSQGHDVWLATPADGQSFARAMEFGLPVFPMSFDPPWHPKTILSLRRFVRDNGVQVIDSHVTRDAKAALFCLDLCAVVRSRHVNQPLKTSVMRRLQWRLADQIITVAECTRDHLIEIGLVDPKRSCAIGGWADEKFFDQAAAAEVRQSLRDEIGLSYDDSVLVCVGMLRPDKGQNYLISALGRLKASGVSPSLVLVGGATVESAAYESDLRRQAEQLGVSTYFLGYREDVSELMQMADVVVIPSLTEAQPRVAVQAFATGRPVVASAVGGVPEIVHDGETGWLVPPAQPDALAAAISHVLSNPAQAAKIAETARLFAERQMRFDHRMAQTLATYQIAMNHGRNRSFLKVRS